jgi:Ca2+-binding RTX toxin-like protein
MFYYNEIRHYTNASSLFSNGGVLLFVDLDARWINSTANGHGILTAGGSRIVMRGSLVADGIAIASSVDALPAHQGDVVEIGAVGNVFGRMAGVWLTGGSSHVGNAGAIGGDFAIRLFGVGNSVANDGIVNGYTRGVQFDALNGQNSLSNTGRIEAIGGDAVLAIGNGFLSVSNSGTITALAGRAIAHDAGSGTTLIVNDGLIEGLTAIALGSGYDQVFNTGTIIGNILLGGGNDRYEGVDGLLTDSVSGGDGNDLLVGGATGEWLYGGEGIDTLHGGGGNDVLNGGAGIDDLDGGEGRDRAVYDDAAGLTVDLEFQELNTGSAAGDILDAVEGVVVTGGASQLFGDAGRNLLIGGSGADLLDGRGDIDRMAGGGGDDIYVVDHRRDRIVEYAGGGSDLVRASSNYVLSDQVEALTLTGTAAVDATGNALANALTGNGAANVLRGLTGSDTLTGGGGVDIFRFDTALGSDVDTITDFAGDRLQLSRSIFTEVNNGAVLAETRFVTGTAAGDAGDRIIHNAVTGELFYDSDGTGAAAQVLFARVTPGTELTYADVLLVA